MAPTPPQSPRTEREGRRPWRAVGITLGFAAVLVACVLLIDPLREGFEDAVSGDTGALREDLRGLGVGGVAMVVLLVAIHTFVWYPAEIIDAAAGFVYGFWGALALLMVTWTLQGLAAYAIGRNAARPLLYRWIGEERFARLERVAEDGGVTLLLAARLVPIVPFSLFSYVAGAARVPVWRFAWTTALGYIPITALSVYLGTRLEHLSPTDPAIWIFAAGLIALLLLMRQLRPLFEDADDDQA